MSHKARRSSEQYLVPLKYARYSEMKEIIDIVIITKQ